MPLQGVAGTPGREVTVTPEQSATSAHLEDVGLLGLIRERRPGPKPLISSEVFRVCGKEREEVAGDVPEDADDAAGRQGCFRVVEFGRKGHP